MRIASWNVNGLRSVVGKGFVEWLEASRADIVGLQETRCGAHQVPKPVTALEGWHVHLVSAARPGYSGVGLLSRRPADRIETSLGQEVIDAEGRVQIAQFGRLLLANVYFPNGTGTGRDNSRVPFKLAFYEQLFRHLHAAKQAGEPIVVMGDWNTAPEAVDLARPKENEKTSGFLPEERDAVQRWRRAGWVDSLRHFDKSAGRYTWWSQRFGVRERNVGWRIDLAMVSPGALPYLRGAAIHPEVSGSDHCPITLELDDAVFNAPAR
jgi:exodeoxyribonuclease-3